MKHLSKGCGVRTKTCVPHTPSRVPCIMPCFGCHIYSCGWVYTSLVHSNFIIPIDTKEAAFFANLAYSARVMLKQTPHPLPLSPPTAHAPLTAKLPPKVVVARVYEPKLEANHAEW